MKTIIVCCGRLISYGAFLCGHYAEFLAQTKLFSTGTNYSYFGGQARFKQMLARAAAAKAG